MDLLRRLTLAGALAFCCTAHASGQAVSRVLGNSIAWRVFDSDSPSISGVVMNNNLLPLRGAIVTLAGQRSGARSDSSGYFTMPVPAPGEWELRILGIGFDSIVGQIVVPAGAALTVVVLVGGVSPVCSNACVSTWCEDLAVLVVDSVTGKQPTVPVKLRVGFDGTFKESITSRSPDPRITSLIVGLGEPVETVGWHSIEISAEGYQPWRNDRVWLENVPYCHGQLIGREHRAALVPLKR